MSVYKPHKFYSLFFSLASRWGGCGHQPGGSGAGLTVAAADARAFRDPELLADDSGPTAADLPFPGFWYSKKVLSPSSPSGESGANTVGPPLCLGVMYCRRGSTGGCRWVSMKRKNIVTLVMGGTS